MELAHGGDPRGPHLAEALAGEGAELVRVQPPDQVVHGLAPGPEVAGARGEGLAAPPQAALEGVRVGDHEARQEGAPGQPSIGRAAQGSELRDAAVVPDRDLEAGFEACAGPGEVEGHRMFRRLADGKWFMHGEFA